MSEASARKNGQNATTRILRLVRSAEASGLQFFTYSSCFRVSMPPPALNGLPLLHRRTLHRTPRAGEPVRPNPPRQWITTFSPFTSKLRSRNRSVSTGLRSVHRAHRQSRIPKPTSVIPSRPRQTSASRIEEISNRWRDAGFRIRSRRSAATGGNPVSQRCLRQRAGEEKQNTRAAGEIHDARTRSS